MIGQVVIVAQNYRSGRVRPVVTVRRGTVELEGVERGMRCSRFKKVRVATVRRHRKPTAAVTLNGIRLSA